jgi:VWFA-related protein
MAVDAKVPTKAAGSISRVALLALLLTMGAKSGAEAVFPKSDIDLQSAIGRISQDLRTQYTLAYYPPNPSQEGKYRRIKVRLRPKGLSVRARQGYIIGDKISR